MYAGSIKKEEDYEDLEKSIVILITNYNLKNLKKIEKYITKWNIREETYQLILTDVLKIYIIELNKARNDLNSSKLNSWLYFINNPEEKPKMDEIEELKEARKILQDISKSKHERYLAELREKYIMDQNAVRAAGYDKGFNRDYNRDYNKEN